MSPAVRRLLPGLVLALALGILGMHALAAHGSHGQVAAASATPLPEGMSHGGHHDAPDEGPVTDDLVMLCAVMLLAAGVALVSLLLRRAAGTSVLPAPAPLARLWTPTPLRLGAGPPAVWRYSVTRC